MIFKKCSPAQLLKPAALARLVWGSLLLLHIPLLAMVVAALVRDGLDLGRLWSVASLALAIAFFSLKFCDVSFLRLGSLQQSWLAFFLIAAVAHQGTLVRHADEEDVLPATMATMVAITTVAAGRSIWRRRTVLQGWARLLAAALTGPVVPCPVAIAEVRRIAPPRSGMSARDIGARAPPC